MPADNGRQDSIAATVTEVSERVTLLVRDEIELAKVEVQQKFNNIKAGILWFGVAAFLGLFGVLFVPMTFAWLFDDIFISNVGAVWVGFAIVVGVFFAGAAFFAFLGWRKVKKGSPPVPAMAIDEAKKIRETVTSKGS